MSRSVAYRRTISDNASWRQDQALNATIYILREIGPTGYLLKEEGEAKKFKVLIGDPHSCTCPVFRKEKDVCKHICWVLLKKFKVPRQNPVTWQLGLVEREINELLRGLLTRQLATRTAASTPASSNTTTTTSSTTTSAPGKDRPYLEQRDISPEDVCPICQEAFLTKHEPVTYCKFGCANSVHIKCMKIWAEHQKSVGEPEIKCPMCRQDFGPYELLRQEFHNSSTRSTRAERLNQHLGTACNKCRISPITGKCYKCVTCVDLHLCQTCFNTDHHRQHSFVFRQKPSQRWRDVTRGAGSVLPEAVVRNLMGRDLSEQDYDILLQLDDPSSAETGDIPEEFIKSLPCEKVRSGTSRLLEPGQQCRICLRAYELGQFVRRLPCNHKFHVDCIDSWLLHRRPCCPLDGQAVWSPHSDVTRTRHRRKSEQNSRTELRPGITAEQLLHIPGIGIASQNAPRNLISANQSGVLRALDHQGALLSLASQQLTMTGNRILLDRPDLLTPAKNRHAPPLGELVINNHVTQATNHRLPPSGRGIRRAHRLATLPSHSPLAGRKAEAELPMVSSFLIGRRASEPGLGNPVDRGRPIHRAVNDRHFNGSRSRSNSRGRSNERQTEPNYSGDNQVLVSGLQSLYLGNAPITPPITREQSLKPRPPVNQRNLRPVTESGATIRCRNGLDMALTGYSVQ